jgi:hypothetical protein
MTLRHVLAAAALLASCAVVSGCTTVDSGTTPAPPSASSASATSAQSTPAASAAPQPFPQLPLAGEFVSQGGTTAGSVNIERDASGTITISLSGFSTEAADDLRMHLNTGSLVTGADGISYVDGGVQLELAGPVDPGAATQQWVYPTPAVRFDPIRSITIYDYATRTAWGSAALAPST